jgi:hypothetical protein
MTAVNISLPTVPVASSPISHQVRSKLKCEKWTELLFYI